MRIVVVAVLQPEVPKGISPTPSCLTTSSRGLETKLELRSLDYPFLLPALMRASSQESFLPS